MTKNIAIALASILIASSSMGEEKKLFDGSVTVDLPKEWVIQKETNIISRIAIQMIIPCKALDPTPLSANASVVIFKNEDKTTLKQLSDTMMQNNYEGFVVCENYIEGENWQTVYSRVNDGDIPFVMIDRFGVSSEYMVHSRIAFPLVKETLTEWLPSTIEQINQLLKSLKIDGTTTVEHVLMIENNMLFLK